MSAPRRSDAAIATSVGLVARLAVVLWAYPRFPPTADGDFYHVLATRIAEGHGYSWLWKDGAVTAVAHYPVGYPALVAGLYAVFGDHPVLAMLLNAALGAASVWAVHRIAATVATRTGALFAALAVALHPGLVLYTPALMTEGVTASLVALAAWCAVRRRTAALVLLGLVLGVATLVRPQTLLFAPLFALVAAPRRRVLSALGVTAIAAACVVPWTVRNCRAMDRCVVVSANGGWNLLIGATPGANGTFVPITGDSVPEPCRTVWGEAEKDVCFEGAATKLIRERPLRWLSLIPAKLSYTFDYAGAAGWYLHASNPSAFGDRAKLRLGVIETFWQRALTVLALFAVARAEAKRRRARWALAVVGSLVLLSPPAWVAIVLLCVSAALLGRRLLDHPPAGLCLGALVATLLTHAVFFGAGRYSLPCFPLIAALAGTFLTLRPGPGDTSSDPKEPSTCP